MFIRITILLLFISSAAFAQKRVVSKTSNAQHEQLLQKLTKEYQDAKVVNVDLKNEKTLGVNLRGSVARNKLTGKVDVSKSKQRSSTDEYVILVQDGKVINAAKVNPDGGYEMQIGRGDNVANGVVCVTASNGTVFCYTKLKSM